MADPLGTRREQMFPTLTSAQRKAPASDLLEKSAVRWGEAKVRFRKARSTAKGSIRDLSIERRGAAPQPPFAERTEPWSTPMSFAFPYER